MKDECVCNKKCLTIITQLKILLTIPVGPNILVALKGIFLGLVQRVWVPSLICIVSHFTHLCSSIMPSQLLNWIYLTNKWVVNGLEKWLKGPSQEDHSNGWLEAIDTSFFHNIVSSANKHKKQGGNIYVCGFGCTN